MFHAAAPIIDKAVFIEYSALIFMMIKNMNAAEFDLDYCFGGILIGRHDKCNHNKIWRDPD